MNLPLWQLLNATISEAKSCSDGGDLSLAIFKVSGEIGSLLPTSQALLNCSPFSFPINQNPSAPSPLKNIGKVMCGRRSINGAKPHAKIEEGWQAKTCSIFYP
jgi:hypothetical protein